MAQTARVEVVGIDDLARGNTELAANIAKRAETEMEKVAEGVASKVAGMVPRVSGALAGSITSGTEDGAAVVGIGAGIAYAGWIEFGGTRGRPYISEGRYLYPTALGAEDLVVAAALEAAKEEIEEMVWPRPT